MAGVTQDDLVNVLQCPVCLEIPKSSHIQQCNRGHHICEVCLPKMRSNKCPICKDPYYGTRNFIAEELIKFFPYLSVVHSLPKATRKRSDEPVMQLNSTPNLCRGFFPCGFAVCDRNFGAGVMLQHVRNCHSPSLIEVPAVSRYNVTWDFPCNPDSIYTTAIRISNMGLFFFILDIDKNGFFVSTVQMVASEEMAACFKFKIKILDMEDDPKISFKDQVFSCRDDIKDLSDNGHCLEFDTNKFSYLKPDGTLACSLSIIDGR